MGVMPHGAMPILKARQQGKRPADMVIVSMIGQLTDETNPLVIADKDIKYRWEWSRGLVVCFFASADTYLARHILDCAKASPCEMYLWDCVGEKGYDICVLPTVESIERPRDQWDLKVEVLRWLPFQEKQFALGE
jgi:hypothetical protein